MNDSGYIKLHRQITNWEWYQDNNTFRVFVHILLMANYADGKFEGRTIRRGQLVTSLPKLAAGTSLTVRQVRVSLDHLKMTGELTDSSYPRYRIITVVKYDEYQGGDRLDDSQMTAKWQADDRLMTGGTAVKRQQYKNNKNIIREEEKEEKEYREEAPPPRRFSPPTREQVQDFCSDAGIQIDVDRFMNYYESVGWKVGGKAAMKDWKAAVRNWASRDAKAAPAPQPRKTVTAQQYGQRDYSQYTQDEGLAMMMAMMQREDDV